MKRAIRGFSIIELVLVVAIAAVMLAVLVPAYNQHRMRESLRMTANQLMSDFMRAEASAKRVGTTGAITPSWKHGSLAGSWWAGNGWHVVDANGNFVFTTTIPLAWKEYGSMPDNTYAGPCQAAVTFEILDSYGPYYFKRVGINPNGSLVTCQPEALTSPVYIGVGNTNNDWYFIIINAATGQVSLSNLYHNWNGVVP